MDLLFVALVVYWCSFSFKGRTIDRNHAVSQWNAPIMGERKCLMLNAKEFIESFKGKSDEELESTFISSIWDTSVIDQVSGDWGIEIENELSEEEKRHILDEALEDAGSDDAEAVTDAIRERLEAYAK